MKVLKTKKKKRRRGRMIVLNSEAAKIVFKKARYKRGDSTRLLSQQLASQVCSKFMKSEG